MKDKFEKWIKWSDAIQADLRSTVILNLIYHDLADIVKANDALPQENPLYWYLSVQHAQSIAMAVRRQVKNQRDSISLIGLLEDVRDNANLITRSRTLSGIDRAFVPRFATAFDDISQGGDTLSEEVISKDIAEVRNAAAILEEYADRVVAHLDKRQPKSWPMYDDLHGALETLERVLYRYRFVITGSLGGSLREGYNPNDHRLPLRQAWIV
jgi:hypothetical protein